MYKLIIKPIFFLFQPEKIHHISFYLIRFVHFIPGVKWLFRNVIFKTDQHQPVDFVGLKFKNKIGLAAGFDKNAVLFEQLESFGFGFVEIGTVTPLPQSGNPQPRLFRLKKDEALINRMGFNNDGVDAVVERLKNRKGGIIIGGNIGKNKVTPNEEAVNDYIICFEKLHDYVDYFVVNVSSPNTPNLRALQEKGPLLEILNELKKRNNEKQTQKPILLKIAPDLTDGQLTDIIDIVKESGIDGIIATNTTIDRNHLKTEKSELESIGNGGLSGKPVGKRSTEVIEFLSKNSKQQIPIIGVGGIYSAKDAQEKIDAGASLVQVYSGFVYEGPGLIKEVAKSI